jgi:methyl-accepting chemotaxis protein
MVQSCPGAKDGHFALPDMLNTAAEECRVVMSDFNEQVIAAKNLILRGVNSEEYKKYLAEYRKSEQTVLARLPKLEASATAVGVKSECIAAFARSYQDLCEKYTEALKLFDPAKPESAKQVDNVVRGVFQTTTPQLNAIAESIREKQIQLDKMAIQMAKQDDTDCQVSYLKAVGLLDKLVKMNTELAEESVKTAQSDNQAAVWMMSSAMAIGVTVLILVGFFIARGITRTIDVLIGETSRLSHDAVAGKLQTRGNAQLLSDEFRPILNGFNATLDALISPLMIAADCMKRISNGDIPETITENYNGEFDEIKNTINRCINAINGLINESEKLAKAATEGNLHQRANGNQFQGKFRDIIHGMNDMLQGFVTPMEDISTTLRAMAGRDFSQQVQKNYPGFYGELRDHVNEVVENLSGAMQQLSDMAGQFAEGSQTVAESAQSLAQGAQSQSASVEEMTASVEELARSIQTVKENLVLVNSYAKDNKRDAEDCNATVQKAGEAMELIRNSSSRISEIIQVISEIAGQTNLLALNAAIEAARAGEHGMGFAVVADEVRKLAERSNQAAREVSSLIKESTERVEEGSRQSEETRKSLQQIVDAVSAAVSKIGEITDAAVEQSHSADDVSTAIQGVAQLTEEAAAATEEVASSSQQLGSQATALRELVGQFRMSALR